MSDDPEFDAAAAAIASAVDDEPLTARIAASSRGSSNPAGLEWLADHLAVDASSRLVDVGAGLGGPAAWFADRRGCEVVAVEPAWGAVEGASRLFDRPGAAVRILQGSALAVPLAARRFDAALVLGVLSVVDDPRLALREAGRVARRLGVWEWCSTEDRAVEAGGSRFPTPDELLDWVAECGWTVDDVQDGLDDPPPSWEEAADVSADDVPDEAEEQEGEVVGAIEAGRLRPFLVVASPQAEPA